MLHGLADSVRIIDADIADAWCLRTHVNENERQISKSQVFQELVFQSERKNRDAIHASLDHSADREFHSFGIVNRGGKKDFVVLLDGQRLERLNDFGEEGISDFRNDQPEHAAASGDQCPGLAIGVVSKLGDGLPNAFCQLCIDCRDLVDCT